MKRVWVLAGALVLPLSFLLFLQWPLRDLVHAGSRTANDAAQILFALYAAFAVTAASRARSHLAAGSANPRAGWWAAAVLLCVAPWGVFMLWSAWPMVRASALSLERFPDTLTPGYFMIKLALGLMLLLIVGDAFAQAFKRRRAPRA
jgi:TRAP-type mannitol/chloroaromatic compound transport system permease small subunit